MLTGIYTLDFLLTKLLTAIKESKELFKNC
jgi:hypothetical protein